MSDRADVVVVGAGQGGAQVAMALRQQRFAGGVVVFGAEPDLPYERPALSKEYLAGDKAFDKLLLRPPSFWAERSVDMRLGARVVAVDAEARVVRTERGESLAYGALVWATGGKPRALPCGGHDLAGVHFIRERADVDRLMRELETATQAVVVGAGYIGLEAAAVLRKKEKRVIVLEAQDRVLSRVAGEALARFFEEEHRARGVDLRLGVQVTCIEEEGGRASGVRLANGDVLPADVVIVGIGILPEVKPLVAAGAASAENGVLVDAVCKTTLPGVYAVGDCAAHANPWARGRVVRLESIQNANDQATIVAKSIAGTLGAEERYDAVPWFWSNQWELRLQTVGLFQDHDDAVVRGDPRTKSFSVVYLREGAVVALDCVNRTKDYVQGKALVVGKKPVDRARLADGDVPLKDLA